MNKEQKVEIKNNLDVELVSKKKNLITQSLSALVIENKENISNIENDLHGKETNYHNINNISNYTFEGDCHHQHPHIDSIKDLHHHEHNKHNIMKEIIILLVGIFFFVIALLISKIAKFEYITLFLYILSYLILGYNVLLSTLVNLKNKKFFDEYFLMTIATIGSFSIGEYSEAVGVFLFFRIGELFENYAVSKSRKALIDISSLKTEEVEILKNGEYIKINSNKIEIGDILHIKVGERIVVDGIVEDGESKMDTSAINGEPIPLSIKKGDKILSGYINVSETFLLKATALVSDSMISKIANAIQNASTTKPKINKFITRFAKIYTPIVVFISLLTAIIPSIISGDWKKWIYSAMTFLVISCPCALVLSVPLAYFSGIGAGSKLGILFKGGNAIEVLGKIKIIAFDKTGTLTNGYFTITEIKSYGNMNEKEILSLCGSCEKNSNHPVAESITEYCKKNNIELSNPDKVSEIGGKGISAIINNKEILCGNKNLLNDKGINIPERETILGSIVYLAVDNNIQGRIIVSDTLKKTSSSSICKLREMGIKTAILTGDRTENAVSMANHLGIDFAKGDLLPEDKLTEIINIRREDGRVMFIGDGFNDGPVLAGADIGGAMFNGSDLALQAADMIFMNSEPETIVKAKKIADKTLFISYENIFFALFIKGVILVLGLLGHPNMWLAVFADTGTGMLLILNSIRVLNIKSYK